MVHLLHYSKVKIEGLFIFFFFIKNDYYNLIEIVGFVVSFLEGSKPKIEEE